MARTWMSVVVHVIGLEVGSGRTNFSVGASCERDFVACASIEALLAISRLVTDGSCGAFFDSDQFQRLDEGIDDDSNARQHALL